MKSFECKNCGAQVSYEPSKAKLRCAFCDSEYVIELPALPPGAAAADRAEKWIIPFRVDKNKASGIYQEWIGKGFWDPKDLASSSNLEKMEGVYIPTWLFDYQAMSAWHGQYSQTQHRQVTKTRTNPQTGKSETYTAQEPYKVWFPKSGNHFQDYLHPVPASKGLAQAEAETLPAVELTELSPFSDEFLSGWQAELPEFDETKARAMCEARLRELEKAACSREVERLDGCSTSLTHRSSKFVFLPVFIMAYTYKNTPYRVLIDGRQGKLHGKKPVSKAKVGIAAAIGIAVIILLIVLFQLFSGGAPAPGITP